MGSNETLIIIDTSVIIKWFALEGDDIEIAIKIRSDFLAKKINLITPAIILWEFNNYLGRNHDPKTAISLFLNFKNYEIPQNHPTLNTSSIAFKIMHKLPKVSYYDASYHALAISKKGTFITADKKYYEKAKSFSSIKLLSNY